MRPKTTASGSAEVVVAHRYGSGSPRLRFYIVSGYIPLTNREDIPTGPAGNINVPASTE